MKKLKIGSMEQFRREVYNLVKKIPKGKVTTYGYIAKQCKMQNLNITPRIVGFILHDNKIPEIPCHRVVTKDGRIAKNYAFGGWRKQRRRLLAEGVQFKDNIHVDLKEHEWKSK